MQTISYELAKRLAEKGFANKESYFKWSDDDKLWDAAESYMTAFIIFYPAYTLDEILGFLPGEIEGEAAPSYRFNTGISDKLYTLKMIPLVTSYVFNYSHNLSYKQLPEHEIMQKCIEARQNPAEAAGLLLEWCIDEGYVKVEEKK